MSVAIIPARGGSKRIPHKNIRLFEGKPIIAWSIEAALRSGCFGTVVVSTDDEQIASVARQYGAEVPFVRPEALSDDFVGTIPVVRHAIRELGLQDSDTELCCIYATAPFVSPEMIARGRKLLLDEGADYALTVTSFPFPVQRALKVSANGRLQMFDPDMFSVRSQDLEEAYHDAGQFYWGKAGAWMSDRPLFGEGAVPVIVPRHLVQDIDTEEDWVRAEWLFRALRAAARDNGAHHS